MYPSPTYFPIPPHLPYTVVPSLSKRKNGKVKIAHPGSCCVAQCVTQCALL